jgi:type II secretory pathway pseudopilin PulG
VKDQTTTIRRLAWPKNPRTCKGVTLLEALISLTVMAMVMMGFIGSFVQSRRVTEASVLHAAATSVIYGIIEQMKGFSYTDALPYLGTETDPTATDPNDPANTPPPCIRVRINQETIRWLRVRYSPAPATGDPTPFAPTTTPATSALAANVGTGGGAIDNWIGAIPLSTVTGTTSQQINLNLWVWVDEVPDTHATELKKITIVYTYLYQDGGTTRTVRKREVFLRSRYDQ